MRTLLGQIISKTDYQDLKNRYSMQIQKLQEAIERLRGEMEQVANSTSDRLRWTQHFKEFSTMTTLDRRAVIAMIQSIRVVAKGSLSITYRYQVEYVEIMRKLKERGKLPPALLITLAEAEKEAV